MLYDGLLLGFITYLSLVFTFTHLPKKVKEYLLNNFLVCDILSILITFFFLTSVSKSILAVIAAIICGLFVNFTLVIYSRVR